MKEIALWKDLKGREVAEGGEGLRVNRFLIELIKGKALEYREC